MSEVAIKSKRQEASNQRSISTATRKDARQSLFVGGLPYEGLTDLAFLQHFQQYGQVIDAVVIRKTKTKSKSKLNSAGFGFVTFADLTVAASLLNIIPGRTGVVNILGKNCELKPSNFHSTINPLKMDKNSNPVSDSSEEKEQAAESAVSSAEKYETRDNEDSYTKPDERSISTATRKDARQSLFVGGLPYGVTDLAFLKHFQQYGQVIDSVVLRGFGFVTFADPTVAASLLNIIPGQTGVVNILGKDCGLGYSKRRNESSYSNSKKKVQTKASKTPPSDLPPSVMPSSKRMRSNTNNVALHRSSGDKRLLSNFHAINPLQMDKNSNLAEARARKEAEERARKEFEDRQSLEAARIKAEKELKARLAQVKEQSEEKKDSTLAAAPKANISPSLSSGNFCPGGFRPVGARPGGLCPGAAPAAAASDSSTENVNTANGGDSARKPLIYSKQMLLSLRDDYYCVCRPDDLIDMTVKVAGGGGGGMLGRKQSSGRGNYNRGGQDGRQGGGDWSRKAMPRDLLEPGDGETDAEKAVSRINVKTLLDMRLSNLNPPSSWEEEDCETKPSQQCLWDTPTREDDIKALAAADRIGGDVTILEMKKKKPNPHDTAPALENSNLALNSTKPIDYKHLLTKFYQQHDDSKVSDVEETLAKLEGREAILFAMLASEYTTANALNSVFEERVKNVQITDHLSLLKIYLSVFHPSILPNSESLLLTYKGGEDELFAELAKKFSAVNALDVCGNSIGKGNESSEEKEDSSGDIPAVESEIGNERLPQQADAQVTHGSGGDEDSALAKPNNDLEESPQSKNVLHENRRNIADEINLDSDDKDDNEIDNTGDIEAAPNQSMMNPQLSQQPLQLDNNEHHVLNQGYQSQASSMQMLAGIPQNNMNVIQMFGQLMRDNPEKMMQMMEQMSQGSITQQGMGGMNDTTNQSSSISPPAVGGESEIGNQKMPQADTQVMHGSGGDGSDSAQGSATPASKPSNESTTREEAEDGESPQSKEKPVAQEYSRGDDDLDYAITTHACTDSGPLPSIWLESKSLKKAIENGTFIDLPNEMKVRVLKYVGAGCYGSVWNVHLYIGSSSKPIACVVKVQYPSKSLNSEYTIHLRLAHRVGQSPAGQEYPFPVSHKLITYCNEEGKGTGGGLFFMSAEEGCNLHTLATEKSPTMGTIVRLADSMLTILETLHVKGKLLHCDVKPDNWVLKALRNGQWSLKLIDFGRYQELQYLTKPFCGSAVNNDEDMMCKVMRQGKDWGVEQDFYGVCGVVFVLIIKISHMEKKHTPIKDGKMEVYFPNSKFLKRDVRSMWKDFFELLLNFDSSDYTNIVCKAREVLKPYLDENKEEIDRDFEDLCRRVSS